MKRSVVLIGGGSLGLAIAKGLEEAPPPFLEQLVIVERDSERQRSLRKVVSAHVVSEVPSVLPSTLVLVAVKPGDASMVCATLRETISAQNVVISCAAGITLESLTQMLGGHSLIVRVMPNLAAITRQAITAMIASAAVTALDRRMIEELFSSIGSVIELSDESAMHGVTALSGSGPGFLAWIAEAMERTAGELGISPEVARVLVAHSFAGLGSMLLQGELSASEICQHVSSPNGTTVAAIRELMAGQVQQCVQRAVLKAAERSHQLSVEGAQIETSLSEDHSQSSSPGLAITS